MENNESSGELRKRFIENPFSILDSKTGNWQKNKRKWIELGIESENGRKSNLLGYSKTILDNSNSLGTSIFDPYLCEIMYKWFCPEGGTILDPFAGGSVRGIVAHKLGYNYTGIELRKEQVDANIEQGKQILPDNQPTWKRVKLR